MKIAVGKKPVAGSAGFVTSVTPSPLLSLNQFDPSRRLLETLTAPLKFSDIRRRSSARRPLSVVFWRSALMPDTALDAVKAPRSMASKSAPKVPR